MSELLVGKQLVVRMQYDDEVKVGKGDLDDVLASVTQVHNIRCSCDHVYII